MEMKWQDQRHQLVSEDKTKHLRINLIRNIWKQFKTIRFLCLTLVLLSKLDLVNLKKVITYALNLEGHMKVEIEVKVASIKSTLFSSRTISSLLQTLGVVT